MLNSPHFHWIARGYDVEDVQESEMEGTFCFPDIPDFLTKYKDILANPLLSTLSYSLQGIGLGRIDHGNVTVTRVAQQAEETP